MTEALGASVLRHVLRDVKASGGEITDAHGHTLASLAEQDLLLLQAASELVERRVVKRVVAAPSQRSFFRVESLARYHHPHGAGMFNSPRAAGGYDSTSQPHDMSLINGNGPNYYNCFDHYCSCAAFHSLAATNPHAMCKHMVAVLLADATDQCTLIRIQDSDFAQMLCAPAD